MRLVEFKGLYTPKICVNPEMVVGVFEDKSLSAMSEKVYVEILTANGSFKVRESLETVKNRLEDASKRYYIPVLGEE